MIKFFPILLLALALRHPAAEHEESVFPGDQWEYRTSPAERAALGIDSEVLDTWISEFSSLANASGMVVRNGYVVAAWGEVDDGLDSWVSTWKSQVGMAAFLAHRDGLLPAFNAPIRSHILSTFDRDLVEGDMNLTFADLGRNISGYGRVEGPGEAYAYADASPNLAAKLVSGSVEPEEWFSFLRNRLDPADGSGMKFQELYFSSRRSTRDAARMAWLWANAGQWDGQELIPKMYFDRYVKPLTPFGVPVSSGTDPEHGDYLNVGGTEIAANYQPQGAYGFWWYFNNRPVIKPGDQAAGALTRKLPGLPHDAFTAFGTGGRYMVAIPSLNMALAVNPSFSINWSGLMDAVVGLDRTPPSPITGLAVAERTYRTATLTWEPSADEESGISRYWIYRNGAWVGETPDPTFTDTELTPFATYTYDIQAFNGHGYATEVSGGLQVSTDPPPVVFSVNFGSSQIEGSTPIPRSEDFAAGIVDAPWWNTHFDDPGVWRDAARNDVPWILSHGVVSPDLRLRTTSPNDNDPGTGIYAGAQSIEPTPESRNVRLHTDSYVNSSTTFTHLGFEVDRLPDEFAHGWNLYVATHYNSVEAWGVYRFDLDLGMDGSVDHTLYTTHAPTGDWTDDTVFANPSQAERESEVGTEPSSYVVFRGVEAGRDSFSLTATNLNPAGRKASINAFQIEALPPPATYDIWQRRFSWAGLDVESLPEANPDGDPFRNLFEYLLDLNPLRKEPAPAFRLDGIEIAGEPWISWTFPHHGLFSDYNLWPEVSEDLQTWSGIPSNAAWIVDEVLAPDPGDGDAGPSRRIRIRREKAGDAWFLRLRALEK